MIINNRLLNSSEKKETDTLAVFAHELKTHVTSIKEAVSLISDVNQNKLDKKSLRIITIAQEEINRLVKMINNFLEVAAIENGKIQLQPESVNINNLINLVLESHSLHIQKKKMHIKKILATKLPPMNADKDRIFEVLSNLIDNAIKFTPEKGTITIKTQLLSKMSNELKNQELNLKLNYIKVAVSDNGPGILKKDLKRIFEKFERSTAPAKIRGIGLGLTIAKTIIELHKGKIWAVSDIGKGANIYLVLPVKN
jgi:signal transduction histidine kinase